MLQLWRSRPHVQTVFLSSAIIPESTEFPKLSRDGLSSPPPSRREHRVCLPAVFSPTVSRIYSPNSVVVHCYINNCSVQAVVDTAADVSIISEKLFDSLSQSPPILEESQLSTAGNFILKTKKGRSREY